MNSRQLILIFFSCILFVFNYLNRSYCQGVEKILSERDLPAIRERVNKYLREHPDASGILYLQAVIEPDAKKSIERYQHLLSKHPTCSYADDARFKIAQYQYALGLYVKARKKFQEVIKMHPSSPLKDDAAYYAARCLFAMDDAPRAERELQAFINQYPNSPLKKLAEIDLQKRQRSGTSSGRNKRRRPAVTGSKWPTLRKDTFSDSKKDNVRENYFKSSYIKPRYALQIGAFLNRTNAFNQKSYFESKGFTAEVSTKAVNRQTLYTVLLNRFMSREAAVTLGEKLREKYRVNYVVVELP